MLMTYTSWFAKCAKFCFEKEIMVRFHSIEAAGVEGIDEHMVLVKGILVSLPERRIMGATNGDLVSIPVT